MYSFSETKSWICQNSSIEITNRMIASCIHDLIFSMIYQVMYNLVYNVVSQIIKWFTNWKSLIC